MTQKPDVQAHKDLFGNLWIETTGKSRSTTVIPPELIDLLVAEVTAAAKSPTPTLETHKELTVVLDIYCQKQLQWFMQNEPSRCADDREENMLLLAAMNYIRAMRDAQDSALGRHE